MKIPQFVPLVESERRKRELAGLVIEILTWGYAAVVVGRIVVFSMLMPFIEDFAYDEPPKQWALDFVQRFNYDSRYAEMDWSTLGTIFLVGSIIGLLVGFTGRGFGPWLASMSKLQVNNAEDSLKIERHWSYARKEGLGLLVLTFLAGWVITKIQITKMFEIEGLQGAGRLALQLACGVPGIGAKVFGTSLFEVFQSFLNMLVTVVNTMGGWFDWTTMQPFAIECVPTDLEYYGNALAKLSESIYLAFMATFFAVPIAFLLAFFAARNLSRHSALRRTLYVLIRMYMNVTRSIEPMIWAILFSVWIGIGPFAGAIALMVHSISSLVKQYSEAIESVDEGPLEAIEATGANRVATAWFAVVPQVVLPYLAFTIYRWDINVRMATIIGLVGGGGIGSLLIQEVGLAQWTRVGTLAFLIFVIVWTMDFLSARVREAIQ